MKKVVMTSLLLTKQALQTAGTRRHFTHLKWETCQYQSRDKQTKVVGWSDCPQRECHRHANTWDTKNLTTAKFLFFVGWVAGGVFAFILTKASCLIFNECLHVHAHNLWSLRNQIEDEANLKRSGAMRTMFLVKYRTYWNLTNIYVFHLVLTGRPYFHWLG